MAKVNKAGAPKKDTVKLKRTYRLSQEVIMIIDQQPNKVRYVEQAVYNMEILRDSLAKVASNSFNYSEFNDLGWKITVMPTSLTKEHVDIFSDDLQGLCFLDAKNPLIVALNISDRKNRKNSVWHDAHIDEFATKGWFITLNDKLKDGELL